MTLKEKWFNVTSKIRNQKSILKIHVSPNQDINKIALRFYGGAQIEHIPFWNMFHICVSMPSN